MARKPMITRTFKTQTVTVLCLDIETSEPFNTTVTLPRVYNDERKLMKEVENLVNTNTVKVVHIVDNFEQETRYGMSEQKFMENAEIIPLLTEKE